MEQRGKGPQRMRVMLYLGGIASLAYLCWWCGDLRQKGESLSGAAHRAIVAIHENDSSTLLTLIERKEAEILRLDQEKVARLLRWCNSKLRGYRRVGAIGIEVGQHGHLVVATEYLENSKGLRTQIQLYVVRTPGGPQVFVTRGIVLACLVGSYSEKYRGWSERMLLWSSVLEGLNFEESALREIGLRGISQTHFDPKVEDWEKLRSLARNVIERNKQRELSR